MQKFIEEEQQRADSQLFLSDRQVGARYGVKRTAIWRWVKKHGFPAPVKLSPGCSRWRLDQILEYERKVTQAG